MMRVFFFSPNIGSPEQGKFFNLHLVFSAKKGLEQWPIGPQRFYCVLMVNHVVFRNIQSKGSSFVEAQSPDTYMYAKSKQPSKSTFGGIWDARPVF